MLQLIKFWSCHVFLIAKNPGVGLRDLSYKMILIQLGLSSIYPPKQIRRTFRNQLSFVRLYVVLRMTLLHTFECYVQAIV